jgi:hypothetical protein
MWSPSTHACTLKCVTEIALLMFCCAGGSALPDPEDIPEQELDLSMEQLEK